MVSFGYLLVEWYILGSCNCNTGRLGLDCNVEEAEKPAILFIDGDGLCDLRTSTCEDVVLFTEQTLDVESLSCYFTILEVGICR